MQLAESFTGKTLIARPAMQTSRQQLHLVFAGGTALMTEPSGRATRQARDKAQVICSVHCTTTYALSSYEKHTSDL